MMDYGLYYYKSNLLTYSTDYEMMQLVPNSSPLSSLDSDLDFDLDLLDCQVPSPCPPSPLSILSPTMFSPEGKDLYALSPQGNYTCSPSPRRYPSPSPSSMSGPYSPAGRQRRISSTLLEAEDLGDINMQDSLLEFRELQDKIKKEQENLLDSRFDAFSATDFSNPFPAPSHTEEFGAPIKLEPFECLRKDDSGTNTNLVSSHPVLKQYLEDTSFQSRFNLTTKPFQFVPETRVIDSGGKTKMAASEAQLTIPRQINSPRSSIAEDSGRAETELMDDVKPVLEITEQQVKPVLDLAVEQVKMDIETTCEILGIAKDPGSWSAASVKSWLLWTLQQFCIPLSTVDMENWNLDGNQMINMKQSEFKARIPQGGETVYAQFDLWRSNWYASMDMDVQGALEGGLHGGLEESYGPPPPYPEYSQFSDVNYLFQCMDNDPPSSPCSAVSPPYTLDVPPSSPYTFSSHSYSSSTTSFSTSTSTFSSSSTAFSSPATSYPSFSSPPPYPGTPTFPLTEEDEDTDEDAEKGSPCTGRSPTNIHLWQFVKELLLQPSQYGNYIHWVDRSQGVFKIIDSVKVATLWGKRKNRPAMNYDKLSRSLRQYYKKGIMKKTERSQRLVYQFCHPYHV